MKHFRNKKETIIYHPKISTANCMYSSEKPYYDAFPSLSLESVCVVCVCNIGVIQYAQLYILLTSLCYIEFFYAVISSLHIS